jgi:hypothetical protein
MLPFIAALHPWLLPIVALEPSPATGNPYPVWLLDCFPALAGDLVAGIFLGSGKSEIY